MQFSVFLPNWFFLLWIISYTGWLCICLDNRKYHSGRRFAACALRIHAVWCTWPQNTYSSKFHAPLEKTHANILIGAEIYTALCFHSCYCFEFGDSGLEMFPGSSFRLYIWCKGVKHFSLKLGFAIKLIGTVTKMGCGNHDDWWI